MNLLVVLSLFLTVSEVLSLRCAAGMTRSVYNSTVPVADSTEIVGALMNVPNTEAECIDISMMIMDPATNATLLYHIFTHSSSQGAVRASYSQMLDFHCIEDAAFIRVASRGFSHCHCRDGDACNSRPLNVTFPAALGGFLQIDCYTGTAASLYPNLAGGIEPCLGQCATYNVTDTFGISYYFYGCAPREMSEHLPEAQWYGITVDLCSTSLCNEPPAPRPVPVSGIACYSGISTNYGKEGSYGFYGSLDRCQAGEVCAALFALRPYYDYYACLDVDVCLSLVQTTNWTASASWSSDGGLATESCCTGDACNYSPSLMGPSKTNTSGSSLSMFNGIQLSNQELNGMPRACQGVAARMEFGTDTIWFCLPDSSVCLTLNVSMNQCVEQGVWFKKFCCFDSDTQAEPECSLGGWQRGKTSPDKCFCRISVETTYVDGSFFCLYNNGRSTFPSIRNAFENTEVAHIPYIDYLDSILGLRRVNGSWAWDDGSMLGYTNWAPNSPKPEDTVALLDPSSLQWRGGSPIGTIGTIVCQIHQ